MAASLKVIDGKMAASDKISGDRQKALDAALAQIDRAFGKGSAMKLGSRDRDLLGADHPPGITGHPTAFSTWSIAWSRFPNPACT